MNTERVNELIENFREIRENIKNNLEGIKKELELEVNEFFSLDITKEIIDKAKNRKDISPLVNSLAGWVRRGKRNKNALADEFVSSLFGDKDIPKDLLDDLKDSYFKYLSKVEDDIFFPDKKEVEIPSKTQTLKPISKGVCFDMHSFCKEYETRQNKEGDKKEFEFYTTTGTVKTFMDELGLLPIEGSKYKTACESKKSLLESLFEENIIRSRSFRKEKVALISAVLDTWRNYHKMYVENVAEPFEEAYGLLLNKHGNLEVFKQEDIEVGYPFPTRRLAEIFLRNNKTNILLYTRELTEWKKENNLS